MSGRTVFRYILACDGCGQECEPEENATEARAQAARAGWHFPSRLLPRTGRKSTRHVTDLCGPCFKTYREGGQP